VRCISLWQPWSSLLAASIKRCETRSWAHRGRALPETLAIHAAKREVDVFGLLNDPREGPHWRQALEQLGCRVWGVLGSFNADCSPLPLGAVVGVGKVVRCFATDRLGDLGGNDLAALLTGRERAFGDYAPGRYGWIFQDLRALSKPIACRGMQGLFPLPDEVLAALQAQGVV
jgi:hypothetical protein